MWYNTTSSLPLLRRLSNQSILAPDFTKVTECVFFCLFLFPAFFFQLLVRNFPNDTQRKCSDSYGYTSKYTPIMDVIRMKDRLLWEEITSDSANPLHELLPAQRARSLRKRGHNYILPPVRTERFKRCFFNRCLFEFV